MTDLLHTIPNFPTKAYTHLLPSLEKRLITTTDLLTLDVREIAKRAQLPVLDVKRLTTHVVDFLGGQLGLRDPDGRETETQTLRKAGGEVVQRWSAISTLDDSIDEALGGGIPTGYITEFTGESGTGKTQILLTLLLSAQLPEPHGLSRPTLYISTEHPLPTSRLTQLLKTHPALQAHSSPPSLSRILTLQTPDLESQEHILTYQLPVALARHKIGLCIIDSIAANYRAERPEGQISHSPSALAYRSNQLVRLGTLLRSLARAHNCAIVVANQVSDRFPPPTIRTPHLPSSNETPHAFSPLLSLDHQQRFFTGWGGHPSSPTSNLKTPSLGPVWTNQIACRIALIKKVENGQAAHPNEMALQGRSGIEKEDENKNYAKKQKSRPVVTKRWMRVVFAPWVEGAGEEDRGVEFEIWSGGVRALSNALTRSRATFGAE